MQKILMRALHERRRLIRQRWEILLRIERVTTPLAHPDLLVNLIDDTLDEVFLRLRGREQPRHGHTGIFSAMRTGCHCGRNPYLVFFIAGEQALLEALVLAQVEESPGAHRHDTSVAELHLIVRAIAEREVDAFCSICQHPLGAATASAPPAMPAPRITFRRAICRGRSSAIPPQCAGRPG